VGSGGKRHRRRLAGLAAVGAIATCAVSPAWLHSAPTPARLLITIHARIRAYYTPGFPTTSMMAAREVTFAPDLINVGTVIISVSNSDNEEHMLEINGVSTKLLGPGGRTNVRVTFKKPGIYPVSVTSDNPVPVSGSLKVIK
jgi:hypothetical protein